MEGNSSIGQSSKSSLKPIILPKKPQTLEVPRPAPRKDFKYLIEKFVSVVVPENCTPQDLVKLFYKTGRQLMNLILKIEEKNKWIKFVDGYIRVNTYTYLTLAVADLAFITDNLIDFILKGKRFGYFFGNCNQVFHWCFNLSRLQLHSNLVHCNNARDGLLS